MGAAIQQDTNPKKKYIALHYKHCTSTNTAECPNITPSRQEVALLVAVATNGYTIIATRKLRQRPM